MTETTQGRVQFFSMDFFNKLVNDLNNDQSLAKITKGLNTNLLLSCNELPSSYLVTVKEGRLSVKETSKNEAAEFSFTAPYQEWEKIARGQAKIQGEVITGKIKFRGSMPKMLLYLNKVMGLESKIMKAITSMPLAFNS